MRVTHLIKVTGVAGAERHLLTLLPALHERGVEADLLLLVEPDNPAEEMVAQAAKLSIPVAREPIPRDITPGLLNRLAERFRQNKPDIVHTHLLHGDLYGMLAARRAGVPYVVSSRHNDDAFRQNMLVRRLNRWLWRRTDHGIAISEHVRRFSLDVEAAPPERLSTVHYGLDPATIRVGKGARRVIAHEVGVPQDGLLVGTVCRLIEQKGVRYGLEAFWQVASTHPDVYLLIVGDGPQRAQLEAQVRGYRLSERVRFLGWRDDARAIIAALDVLLAPSLWEGFGLNLLEAMALHTPILASQVSAIPEVVLDGQTGLLAPPADVDHLVSSLTLLLEDAGLRRAFADAAYERLCSDFSVPQMADRTLGIYQALLNKGKASAAV